MHLGTDKNYSKRHQINFFKGSRYKKPMILKGYKIQNQYNNNIDDENDTDDTVHSEDLLFTRHY